MILLRKQPRAHQAILCGAVSLILLVGALFVVRGITAFRAMRSSTNLMIPVVRADIGQTTCGTYTVPDGGFSHDGIEGPPFPSSGEQDPDCDTPDTGLNICLNGTYGDNESTATCFCQQPSGGNCGSLVPPPSAPSAVGVEGPDGRWDFNFHWSVNVLSQTNCVLYYLYHPADNPDTWRCIHGSGEPDCDAPAVVCEGTWQQVIDTPVTDINPNWDIYFGLVTVTPGELRSEIRTTRSYVEDYSIAVTPPANTKIVTGETTAAYTVVVTPIGGATGNVTLSLDAWNPAIAGIVDTWPGGRVVNLEGSLAERTKTFTIATDDGSPPTWPPTTRANIYDFRVKGTHATIPPRSEDVFGGLTVMDYRMTSSVPQIDMDATGDTDGFDVNFEWLPSVSGSMYDRTVDLDKNDIAGLTVDLSQDSVTQANGSIHVDLSTDGVASGPHTLTITGTGNPGGLLRQAQVIINIGLEKDFTLSIAIASQNVSPGGTVNNTTTITSLNGFSEPVRLTGAAIKQGDSIPEPSISFIFTPPQPQPLPDNTINSQIQLTTTGATPCLPGGGQRYSVTIEGHDDVQVGPPDATRSISYDLFVLCAAAPRFEMVAVPNPQSVIPGGTATYQVTVTSLDGFNDTVNLDLNSPCATGSVCNFPSSVVVTPSTPGVFNFVVITDEFGTPTGGYQMELLGTAQSGPENDSLMIILNVEEGPDYTFTVAPDPLDVILNTSGTYTVTITPIGGFASPVRISWTMSPSNPNIVFVPTSDNLVIVPGNTGSISVTAHPGSLGNYLLDFTATPQGTGPTKYIDDVELNVINAICNGDCPNICVDQTDDPLVPQQICTNDTQCPPNYRCASQTCRGPDGCSVDPPPGEFDCNNDICYDDSGDFIIPPPSLECYQSWPRCKQYDVLKVKKDRQCDRWLSCEEAVIYDDPSSKKEVTQCLKLGVCSQLSPNGECANWIPQPGTKENVRFLSPFNVSDKDSPFRYYSGYSSGFHFTGEASKVCQGKTTQTCIDDAACGEFAPCLDSQQIIETTYPSQAIEETGLDGAAREDPVANGNFEELRCYGGPRDGLPCILPSDCRVGDGICTNKPETADPPEPNFFSVTPCTKDIDCEGATTLDGNHTTKFCRYLFGSSAAGNIKDISCRNPLDASWLGIVPLGSASEAGFGYNETHGSYEPDKVLGQKRGEDNTKVAVQFRIREEDENFTSIASKIPTGDPRHPIYAREDHLKDANNFVRVAVTEAAEQFSGAGIALPANFNVSPSRQYTLTFKMRRTGGSADVEIQPQLSFGYEKISTPQYCARDHAHVCTNNDECVYAGCPVDGDDCGPCVDNDTQTNYEKTDTVFKSFTPQFCEDDPGHACTSTPECTYDDEDHGPCVSDGILPQNDWQTYVLGPISPPDEADQDKITFLNFVSTGIGTRIQFDIDDVTLKPVLETATGWLCVGGENDGMPCTTSNDCLGATNGACVASYDPLDVKKLERRCRLFPNDNSPECDYKDAQRTRYRGWKGYCLDKDPQNDELCLTWWPLDLLAGESPFTANATPPGYSGPWGVPFCMQAQGGAKIAEHGNVANTGLNPVTGRGLGLFQWSRASGWDAPGDAGDRSGEKLPDIRWRDLERVELRFVANRGEWNNMPLDKFRNVDVVRTENTSEYALTLWQDIDTANNKWGWGGFAWGNDDFQNMLDLDCNGDNKWARIDVHFSNNNPNDENAFVESVNVRICSADVAVFGLRVLVTLKARESCNIMSTVVTDTGQNKAWVERTNSTSPYTVPNLGYGYFSVNLPHGAASALPQSARNAESAGVPGYSFFEPSTQAINTGTPYSCLGDCNHGQRKYCYLTQLTTCGEPGGDNPPHYWDFCTTGTESNLSCKTQDSVTDCAGQPETAVCVGAPLGRCSENLLKICDPADPGSCTGAGTCLSPAEASNKPVSFAVDRVQRLFAQSFECKILQADDQQIDRDGDGPDADDPREIVYSYVGCPPGTLFPGPNQDWDIGVDGPPDGNGAGPIYCAGARGDADYCALRPTITGFTIDKVSGGNINVLPNKTLTGRYAYTINPEQEPKFNTTIVWDNPQGGDPKTKCRNAEVLDIPETGRFTRTGFYEESHSGQIFVPVACVIDNWGAMQALPFPGTITVQ